MGNPQATAPTTIAAVYLPKDSIMINRTVFRFRAATMQPIRRADERGANLVEYTLLVGLIALVCVAAVTLLGGATEGPYSEISSGIGG